MAMLMVLVSFCLLQLEVDFEVKKVRSFFPYFNWKFIQVQKVFTEIEQ